MPLFTILHQNNEGGRLAIQDELDIMKTEKRENMSYRIAVVEDDTMMKDLICFVLNNAGFKTTSYSSAGQAEEGLLRPFDLWLLDIMLETPTAGFDLMKKIKAVNPEQALCFLSARDSELDKITGLEIGCDDYITKPFSKKELVLRITNILRRTSPGVHAQPSESEILNLGSLRIDVSGRRLSEQGREVNLTAKEFDLICLLVQNAERTVDRNTILRIIWDTNYFGSGRVLDDTIRRIRKKVPGLNIETIYGEGYRVSRQ